MHRGRALTHLGALFGVFCLRPLELLENSIWDLIRPECGFEGSCDGNRNLDVKAPEWVDFEALERVRFLCPSVGLGINVQKGF